MKRLPRKVSPTLTSSAPSGSTPPSQSRSLLDPTKREALESLSINDLTALLAGIRWRRLARAKQLPPSDLSWDFFGVKSGRGFGKTLCAANWIWRQAWNNPGSIWFVIAPTHEDLIKVCFYGPTGLHGSYEDRNGTIGPKGKFYPIIPTNLIRQKKISPYPMIELDTGAEPSQIIGFSADTPERLRGPQSWGAWCDEVASWRYPEKAWDNLIMGMRLGPHPQLLWTGTPKPKPFVRTLVKLPRSIVITGSTYENRANLPNTFYENVAKYEGTAIGRQEIWGEVLDPEESGFIKRSQWRLWPAGKPLPKFRFIIYSLDTAFTEKTWDKKDQTGDPTACTVWGLFEHNRVDNVMLLDAWEEHLGFPGLISRVRTERNYTYGDADEPVLRPVVIPKHLRASHQGRKPDILLIEEKGSGISLRQMLAVENILTESYNPGAMDKLSRLHAVSPCFAARRVWALESERKGREGTPKSWADPVITQFCSYVGEGSLEHDDLLDTGTQALRLMMDRFAFRFTAKVNPQDQVKRHLERLRSERRRNPYDG